MEKAGNLNTKPPGPNNTTERHMNYTSPNLSKMDQNKDANLDLFSATKCAESISAPGI